MESITYKNKHLKEVVVVRIVINKKTMNIISRLEINEDDASALSITQP